MAKFMINHDDAKKMHSSFFDGDFEVVKVKVAGFLDGPIWSLAGGGSFGSWEGIASTNGDKIVFSKTGYIEGKIKKTWELPKTEIEKIDQGLFKSKIFCKTKQKGLTTAGIIELLVRLMFIIGIFLYKNKRVDIKITNEFNNLENFKQLLSKLS